jgi:hypothetical protein
MGEEVSNIDFSIPVYEPKQDDSPKDDDELQEIEESKPVSMSSDAKAFAYSSPGISQKQDSGLIKNPVETKLKPKKSLTTSITKLEERIQFERTHLNIDSNSSDQAMNFTNNLQKSSPADAVRFSLFQNHTDRQSGGLKEKIKQDEIILAEAKRLQSFDKTKEAQRLIEDPGVSNTFVRIHDLREGLITSLDSNTEDITKAQTALDELTQSQERLDPFTKKAFEDSYTRQKETAEDSIAGKLGTRQYQLRLMMEANELVVAGDYSKAESLLNGSMTFRELGQSKLGITNPNAPKQTNSDGSEKTNEEVVQDTREALQATINANRSGLQQLDKQISTLSDTIRGKAPKPYPDPFGVMPKQQASQLTTQPKLELMEQRNLLQIQRNRLHEETERLFLAHDKITDSANTANLQQARDIAEGREAILSRGERPSKPQTRLSDRQFAKNPEEELAYQTTLVQLEGSQDTTSQLSILIRGDAKNREGGLEAKISDSNKEIADSSILTVSGALSSLGGRTEALRQSLGAERANKKELEQLEEVVSKTQTRAASLISQGKYEQATKLLKASNKAISKGFQASNTKLLLAYKGANEQLKQFDRNLKDTAVQGAKVVAISAVAAALAPATGGGSLAVLTALGTGTLAGVGVGVAIDSIDAAINIGAFDESFSEAASRVVSRDNIYNNAKTAFSGALAGASAVQIVAKLEKFGSLASAAGAAGGASALVTTINLTEQRIQAELAFNEALKSNPDLNKDEFMEDRGVSASQLAKAFTVDTSVGVLSGLVGLRAGSIKEAARTGLTKGATEVGEEAASAVIGLVGAYVNDGELTAESIKDELMAATVGNRAGKHSSEATQARRIKERAASNINIDSINPTADLADGVQAQTTLRFNNDGELVNLEVQARPELIEAAREGNSDALAIIREEQQGHAKEQPIDPLNKETGKPNMSKDAYIAQRLQRELAMQVKGKALQAHVEGKSVSGLKQGTKQALVDITEQIKTANYQNALGIAKANGLSETYIKQLGKNYDDNIDPSRPYLEQTSFNAVVQETRPSKTERKQIQKQKLNKAKELLLENPDDFQKQYETLEDQTLEILRTIYLPNADIDPRVDNLFDYDNQEYTQNEILAQQSIGDVRNLAQLQSELEAMKAAKTALGQGESPSIDNLIFSRIEELKTNQLYDLEDALQNFIDKEETSQDIALLETMGKRLSSQQSEGFTREDAIKAIQEDNPWIGETQNYLTASDTNKELVKRMSNEGPISDQEMSKIKATNDLKALNEILAFEDDLDTGNLRPASVSPALQDTFGLPLLKSAGDYDYLSQLRVESDSHKHLNHLDQIATNSRLETEIPDYQTRLAQFKQDLEELSDIPGTRSLIEAASGSVSTKALQDPNANLKSVLGFFTEARNNAVLRETGLKAEEISQSYGKKGKDEIDLVATGSLKLNNGEIQSGEFHFEHKNQVSTFLEKNFQKSIGGQYLPKLKDDNQIIKQVGNARKNNAIPVVMFRSQDFRPREMSFIRGLLENPQIRDSGLMFLNGRAEDITPRQ